MTVIFKSVLAVAITLAGFAQSSKAFAFEKNDSATARMCSCIEQGLDRNCAPLTSSGESKKTDGARH